jgi:putative transposase
MMPRDLPSWSTAYGYFRRWRIGGAWEGIRNTLREKVRVKAGRDATPSAAIMHSQTVKTS